ncbi:MAG: hypothetical protein KAG94_01565 [Clostridiales bacterium]|nr:hypothetical protein [Clostridiales bacterium]
MKKTIILIIILTLLLNLSGCGQSKLLVTDFSPKEDFTYYPHDEILYHEILHDESGYFYNTLTKTEDVLPIVLQYYALLIGEYLEGFSGDSLKLSGEYVKDGTFFKFEVYKEAGYTNTFIEIPMTSNLEVDKLIESKWSEKWVPKANDTNELIKKSYKDNGQVTYTYLSKDIDKAINYYVDKCKDKEGYSKADYKITYRYKEQLVTILFDQENNLIIITQNK